MFKKILIANRGEIALRVIHACRELGIKTVAVYSEADEHALHVRFADEDICIGPARSADSYLSVPAIISAAEITGADAIHPGYGFLSESAYLAEVCEACHIRFIGPDPHVIRLMGDKARARRAMKKAGVPILPGSDGPVEGEEQAQKVAREIGYPVIIKATAGGGGRGMRVVENPGELAQALKTAQREAEAAFGIGDVYIEKYVVSPRHIEFQVLGDHYGSVVSLGERECSIQRRHQKLLEESPSVALTEKIRRKMGGVVVDAAKAVQYANAGTFEFLMDKDGRFYFMEVNTRLQVEHPVTEMVTGIDIVKEQIRVAAGERLSFKQSEVTFTGHAIECRINAEDPVRFTPSPGTIDVFSLPGGPGVRIDTAAHTDCVIPPYYDSMIAKVIAHGRDRNEAIARMRRALEMSVIEGIKTTIPLHLKILNDPDFQAGRLSTSFMDRYQVAKSDAEQAASRSRLSLPGLYAVRGRGGRRRARLGAGGSGRGRARRRRDAVAGARASAVVGRAARRCRGRSSALAAPFGAAVVVNDRADMAVLAGAAGVHVGQDDLSPADARAIVGAGRAGGRVHAFTGSDRGRREGAGELHRRRARFWHRRPRPPATTPSGSNWCVSAAATSHRRRRHRGRDARPGAGS